MSIDTNKTDVSSIAIDAATNNPPTVASMNAALVDLTKANEKEQGAGLRFAIALYDYRAELPHSLSDMVHNKTVHKRDKKSGRVGTELVSTASLHKTFLNTLPAYQTAVKEAEGTKLKAIDAMDSDKVALATAKKEIAAAFINKTRVAMVRAVEIAFFLHDVKAQAVAVDKTGKEISYDFPVVTVTKGTDGAPDISKTTFKTTHYTLNRLANVAKQHIADNKVKPAAVTPQSQQGQDNVTVTVPKGSEATTAASLSQAIQSASGERQKEIVNDPATEVLLCNILAARFMKDRVLDLPAFYAWVSTQSYFKTDGHSVNGQIVPTSTLVKAPRKTATK